MDAPGDGTVEVTFITGARGWVYYIRRSQCADGEEIECNDWADTPDTTSFTVSNEERVWVLLDDHFRARSDSFR